LLLNEGWQFLPKPFMCNMLKVRIRDLLGDERLAGDNAASGNVEIK
jgi:hypothetical protein